MNIPALKTSRINFEYRLRKFDLELKSNLTFVTDKSATGKSFMYNALYAWSISHHMNYIISLNSKDIQKLNLSEFIMNSKDKLFIIDNADIILDDQTRMHISLDVNNQYILIGRRVEGLLLTNDNMCSLDIDDNNTFILNYA